MEWISVKEKLPKNGKQVVFVVSSYGNETYSYYTGIFHEYYEMDGAGILKNVFKSIGGGGFTPTYTTHWFYLSPPKH